MTAESKYLRKQNLNIYHTQHYFLPLDYETKVTNCNLKTHIKLQHIKIF